MDSIKKALITYNANINNLISNMIIDYHMGKCDQCERRTITNRTYNADLCKPCVLAYERDINVVQTLRICISACMRAHICQHISYNREIGGAQCSLCKYIDHTDFYGYFDTGTLPNNRHFICANCHNNIMYMISQLKCFVCCLSTTILPSDIRKYITVFVSQLYLEI